MLIDGLHNRVDIYVLNEVNVTDRLNHNKVLNDVPSYTNIACRVIKDEKAIFESDIPLKMGDVIFDTVTGRQFNIRTVKKVQGLNKFHHLSCAIEIRRVGDLNARRC